VSTTEPASEGPGSEGLGQTSRPVPQDSRPGAAGAADQRITLLTGFARCWTGDPALGTLARGWVAIAADRIVEWLLRRKRRADLPSGPSVSQNTPAQTAQ
jgi:hypothetical protein